MRNKNIIFVELLNFILIDSNSLNCKMYIS